jgi:hypothetical protein
MNSMNPGSGSLGRRLTDWVRLRLASPRYRRVYLGYWKLKQHLWLAGVAATIVAVLLVVFILRGRLGAYLIQLDSSLLPQLCIGVGAALIGLIAVVFTLSLYVIQQISDRSVPGILREYAADDRMRAIYTGLSVVAIACLMGAMVPYHQHPILIFGLPIFCAVSSLLLLAALFDRVAYLSDPSNIVLHIWNTAMAELKRLGVVQAELLRLNPAIKNETDPLGHIIDNVGMTTAALYTKAPYLTKRLNKSLSDLHSLMRHFAAEQQYTLLGETSDAIVHLIGKYIELRGSSLMMANSTTAMLGLESGWDASVVASVEAFDALMQTAVESGNTHGANTLLKSLTKLALVSIPCKPYGAPSDEHPTVDFILAYMTGIAKQAVTKGNIDIILCFNHQGLTIAARLAVQGYWLSTRTMIETWSQITTASILSRQQITATDITGVLLKLLAFIVEQDELAYSDLVKHLRDTVMKLCRSEATLAAETGQPLGASLSASPDTPLRFALSGVSQTSIQSIHARVVNLIACSDSDDKYESWSRGVHMLDQLDDQLWMWLVKIGEASASGTVSVLFYLNECAYGIAEQLLWLRKHIGEVNLVEPDLDSIADENARVEAATRFDRRQEFEAELEKLLNWHVMAFYSRCTKLKPTTGTASDVRDCLGSSIGIAVQALGLGLPELAAEIGETVGLSCTALLNERGLAGVVETCRAISVLPQLGLIALHQNSTEVLTAVESALKTFLGEVNVVIDGHADKFQNWRSPVVLVTEKLAKIADGRDYELIPGIEFSVWQPTYSDDEASAYLQMLRQGLAG